MSLSFFSSKSFSTYFMLKPSLSISVGALPYMALILRLVFRVLRLPPWQYSISLERVSSFARRWLNIFQMLHLPNLVHFQ